MSDYVIVIERPVNLDKRYYQQRDKIAVGEIKPTTAIHLIRHGFGYFTDHKGRQLSGQEGQAALDELAELSVQQRRAKADDELAMAIANADDLKNEVKKLKEENEELKNPKAAASNSAPLKNKA